MEYLVDGKTEAQWRRMAHALERMGDKEGAAKALEKANERIDSLMADMIKSRAMMGL